MKENSSISISECIRKTRDGKSLSSAEIVRLVGGASDGSIPDYQLSAWLMAVTLRDVDMVGKLIELDA